MKILIVEDNPGVRRMIRLALRPLAAEFFECSDGAEAQAAYVANRPDFVLMDIQMPHQDGIRATRQIFAAHDEARVVMLTDHDGPELREAAREAGACWGKARFQPGRSC